MQVQYISHSGFLLETPVAYYLFDYFQGPIPALAPEKPLTVFISHGHKDHYSPGLWPLLAAQGRRPLCICASRDIARRDLDGLWDVFSAAQQGWNPRMIRVRPHESHELSQGQKVFTLKSTDQGVAFLLEEESGLYYHAGDLHDWVWIGEEQEDNAQMTYAFRQEIDLLISKLRGRILEAAFLPIDPRQGGDGERGMLHFLSKVRVRNAYAMHFWDQPQFVEQFLARHPEHACRLRLLEPLEPNPPAR